MRDKGDMRDARARDARDIGGYCLKSLLTLMTLLTLITANAQGLQQRRTLGSRLTRPTAAASQPQPSTSTSESASSDSGGRSIEFNAAPLGVVLEVYQGLVGKTVLRDPQVTEPSPITLKPQKGQELSVDEKIEAIETVLEMNGVHIEPYGEKFVRALPRQGARKHGIPLYLNPDDYELKEVNRVVSVALNVKYADIDGVNTILQKMLSDKGDIIPLKDSQKIVVTDTEMNLKRMLDMVKCIDVPNASLKVKMFPREFTYATARNVMAALQACVDRSKQYEQEVSEGKQKKAVQQGASQSSVPRTSLLNGLRRPGPGAATPTARASFDSLSSAQDSPVLVRCHPDPIFIGDENIENKLIIITWEENMTLFDDVIRALDIPHDIPINWFYDVVRLKYADAEETSDKINDLLSANGKNSKSSKSGTGGKTAAAAGSTQAGARQNVTQRSANTPQSEIVDLDELTPDTATVLADKRINGLVVKVKPGRCKEELLKLIELMDIKLSQVLIETVIIEVGLGDDISTGIDWVNNQWTGKDPGVMGGGGGGSNSELLKSMKGTVKKYSEYLQDAKQILGDESSTYGSTSYSEKQKAIEALADSLQKADLNDLGTVTPVGTGLNYFLKSNKLNLSAVINAAKTDSHSKYIASPVIMTLDNKEAQIKATEMRYLFKGYTYSGSTYNGSAVPDYEQKELGITIKTTPKINPNGTVMLTIEEEYSQEGNGQAITAANGTDKINAATTITRTLSADALLEDGQTVVFGGLTETKKSEKTGGIPILKDIPIIGKWIFGYVEDNESRKELLVFMTPYVLNDAQAAQVEALRRKKSLSDSSPWDDHGWSASALADPVSKKEQMRRIKEEARKQDEERKTKIAIEKWKVERAKKLQEMSVEERAQWLLLHKEDLDKEAQEELEDKMLDAESQAELKKLAEEVRAKKLDEAEKEIKQAEAETAAENERAKLDAAKKGGHD